MTNQNDQRKNDDMNRQNQGGGLGQQTRQKDQQQGQNQQRGRDDNQDDMGRDINDPSKTSTNNAK